MAQIESQNSSSTSADATVLVQDYPAPRNQEMSSNFSNNFRRPRGNFNPMVGNFRPRNFGYRHNQYNSSPNFSQLPFRNSDPSGFNPGFPASFNNSQHYQKQQQSTQSGIHSVNEAPSQNLRFVPLLPPFNIEVPGDAETCTVCSEKRALWSISPCSHSVCLFCAAKLLLLCNSPSCSACRASLSEVYFTRTVESWDSVSSRRRSFQRIEHSIRIEKEGSEPQTMTCALFFEDADVRAAFDQLQLHYCALCSESREHLLEFSAEAQLKQHLSCAHELFYCQICMDHLRLFPFERRTYTRAELNTHLRIGDRTLRRQPPADAAPDLERRLFALWKDALAESASYRGHPQCMLCQKRLFDDHELFRHRRRDHFFCPLCDVDAPNDGAIYFRTVGQLRHHCVTKHHLCHECEHAGEQLLSCVFRNEIDMRAHRLQQHSSGLSRAQLAAERVISPAELNFNFGASSSAASASVSASGISANRRTLQSRAGAAPSLADYVPPPEQPGNTTRQWQRVVQRAEQASAAREQLIDDENVNASAAAGAEHPETAAPESTEPREEYPSLYADGSTSATLSGAGGLLISEWNSRGGRSHGASTEQDFPALVPTATRRNHSARAVQANTGSWAYRGSAGREFLRQSGDDEATNSEPEYPQLGPAGARLPFRPARHVHNFATAANSSACWTPSSTSSSSRGPLEYMDMAAGGRSRVHQPPVDYESLLAETTRSSGSWVRLQKGEGRDRDSLDLAALASDNAPAADTKPKKPDTAKATKKDTKGKKKEKEKEKKEKTGANSGAARDKAQHAADAAEDGELSVEPPPGLVRHPLPKEDPPDSWEDACDNLSSGPPPGLHANHKS